MKNWRNICGAYNSSRGILVGRYFTLSLTIILDFIVIFMDNIIEILDGTKYFHLGLIVLFINMRKRLVSFLVVSSHSVAIFNQIPYIIFVILYFFRNVTVYHVYTIKLIHVFITINDGSWPFFVLVVPRWHLSIIIATIRVQFLIIRSRNDFIFWCTHRLSSWIVPFQSLIVILLLIHN